MEGHCQSRRFKKQVSWLLIVALIVQYCLTIVQTVSFAENGKAEIVTDQKVASGITFRQTNYSDFNGEQGKKEQAFILTADMNDPTVNIISSKAKDKVLKLETVSEQIAREQFKGQNVVAGINGDMFNISSGTPTYGTPIGLQVKDGYLITGFDQKSAEGRYPVFAVTNNRKPMIGYVSLDAKLTVVDSVYESVYGIPNPNKIAVIDTLNRIDTATMGNKMILETPQLADSPTVSFTDAQAANGALTVLKNIQGSDNGQVKLGQVYEAEVVSVGSTSSSFKSIAIPVDGMVLASQGTKATWIKNNLKAGDKVRFSFNLTDLNGNPLELAEAVTSWGMLVENNHAYTEQELIAKYGNAALIQGADKARTAIGITSDNKVVALAVDGGGAAKQSYGMTLPEMAAMMKDLGVVSAISLDGGGSTQMNTRLYGDKQVRVANNPSDGSERIVTNAILFTSSAPKTNAVHDLKVDQDLMIYKNNSFTFKVRGTDQGGNPVDIANADIEWSVRPTDGGISSGSIDQNGVYRAGAMPVTEAVYAQIGSVQGFAKVTVVDSVYSIGLTDSGTVALEANKPKAFTLAASTEDGKPIVISNASAEWSVTPASLGTFDENGVLTTADTTGSGIIKAKIGDKETTLSIIVGQKAQLIDGYEQNDPSRYYIDGYVGGTHEISTEQVKSGSYSLKVNYDYAKWTKVYNGTINVRTYPAAKGSGYTTTIRPKKLGMWVYGDGKAPWLRAIITDGTGANRTLDMASSIYWTGWKYVEVPIPSNVPMPITLNYFYMVETNKSLNYKGTVYFDDIRFSYTDDEDLKEPAYSNVSPSAATVYSAEIPFFVTLTDEKTGIDPAGIAVKMDGQPVTIGDGEDQAHFDTDTGILTYTAKALSEGPHTFVVEASDKAGNRMNPPLTKNVMVNLQPDVAPPVISGLLPLDGNTLKLSRPKLSAQIKDVQSGVNEADVRMTLDGQDLQVYYDPSNGWAYALPDTALSVGSHTFTVNAKDKAGNVAESQSVTFTVVDFAQPSNPGKFAFSVTSDTHATGFAPLIFDRINNDDSELVLQNGDLVDNDNAAQWTTGRNQIALLNKPYMISPGNHEGFNGSLTNYYTYFGVPTYSFEYGNTLFISLNSALGQSISGPDPTQFHYLQRVLNENTKPNVVIFTHNPTRDTFGTAHQMLESDADRLEKMLGEYKAANPEKSVNVIFGHLHVSQSWMKDGVTYTISGDGALKKYVTPANGGFLSYTQFKVDGTNVTHKFLPLTQKITVMDDAIQNNGRLTLPQGVKRTLNVYGDFFAITADYLVNLSKFADVDKKFTSSDDRVVSVSEAGELTAHQVGTAEVTITVSGITTTLPVEVVDQNEVVPIRMTLSPNQDSLNGNEKLVFGVTGYDVFGNTFAIDNSKVNWSVIEGIGQVNNGEFTAAELTQDTTGTVVAEFNGMKAQATLIVNKTVKPVEDRTPPAVPTGLHAEAGNRSVTLFWDANRDEDLKGYWIYDGSDTPVFVEKGITSKTFVNLEAGRAYVFRIAAEDQAGNLSAQSEPVESVPAMDDAGQDLTSPVWVNGELKAAKVTETGLRLEWTPAEDDTAVEAYRIYLDDQMLAAVSGSTNVYEVTGLASGKLYTFRVEAGDKANNWSTEGLTLQVRTKSAGSSGGGSGDPSAPATNPAGLYAPKSEDLTVQNGRVKLDIPQGTEVVALPVNVAERIGQQSSVVLESGELKMTIPSSVLASAAKFLPPGETDGRIEVKMRAVSAAPNLELSEGGQTYELTIEAVTKNGETSRLSQFNTPITIHISAPHVKNPKLAGIYYISPEGEYTFIGGTYEEGGYTAELSHFSTYGVFEYTRTYQDVPATHWAFSIIQELSFKGIADGKADNRFAPDSNVTRAEFAAFLVRTLGGKAEPSGSPFEDVKNGDWYTEAVHAAYGMGLVQGTSPNRFEPDRFITREEMAAMIVRAIEKKTGTKLAEGRSDFQDGNQISQWAEQAVNQAAALKLIEGRGNGLFVPKGIATRAESAKLILLLMQQK